MHIFTKKKNQFLGLSSQGLKMKYTHMSYFTTTLNNFYNFTHGWNTEACQKMHIAQAWRFHPLVDMKLCKWPSTVVKHSICVLYMVYIYTLAAFLFYFEQRNECVHTYFFTDPNNFNFKMLSSFRKCCKLFPFHNFFFTKIPKVQDFSHYSFLLPHFLTFLKIPLF